MGKLTEAGIGVSKDVLDVAVGCSGERLETARFDNEAGGHGKLVRWLTKCGRTARVVLEATGTYSLDVALARHRARGIEVMDANPRAIKQFAGALMQRSKTDLTAAVALREYAARMPFVVWVPPASYGAGRCQGGALDPINPIAPALRLDLAAGACDLASRASRSVRTRRLVCVWETAVRK